jgi:hypothetical protein
MLSPYSYMYIHALLKRKRFQKRHFNDMYIRSGVPPGVDVMITIFCDFRPFSAKKLAFFSKTNVMIKILHILALF